MLHFIYVYMGGNYFCLPLFRFSIPACVRHYCFGIKHLWLSVYSGVCLLVCICTDAHFNSSTSLYQEVATDEELKLKVLRLN